jgi:hypothetical protein
VKTLDLDNLIASMGTLAMRGRTFRYHRDEYALLLLGWAVRDRVRVSELRQTPLAPLLKKPITRRVLSRAADGWVRAEDLTLEGAHPHPYVVTIGRWGDPEDDHDDNQTTRRGENLVVQVNFPDGHDWEYRMLVDPRDDRPFASFGHPVSSERLTMAWARIDLDLASGEALIEEIQSDWVREAMELYAEAREVDGDRVEYDEHAIAAARYRQYVERVLLPHARIWAEVTLCATLWVLHEVLGVSRFWYHTHEGGTLLKGPSCTPPRSLYTSLPRRFCFRETARPPSFLQAGDTPALGRCLGPEPREELRWRHLDL